MELLENKVNKTPTYYRYELIVLIHNIVDTSISPLTKLSTYATTKLIALDNFIYQVSRLALEHQSELSFISITKGAES